MAPGEAERRAAAAVKPRQPELQRGRALLRGHGEPGVGVIMSNNACLRSILNGQRNSPTTFSLTIVLQRQAIVAAVEVFEDNFFGTL